MDVPVKNVGGSRVLYLMAAPAEYGDCLKALFTPVFIGVGPVEAAIATTRLLSSLASMNKLPDIVVSLGSAGSQTLEQSEVHQASTVSYRDMDASPLGFAKGLTPFADHPVAISLGYPIEGVPQARLSTGANVVTGQAYRAIDADMVDMESFAVLRACQAFDVPLIALRGISDGAGDLHHYDDWTRYLHDVDRNLAEAVRKLEAGILSGAIL